VELREGIRTTGSVRSFTDQPVPDSVVAEILDDARFAPSGGNRQGWRVAVVKDRVMRRSLGDLMQPVWDEYMAISMTGLTPFTAVNPSGYQLESTRAGNVPNGLIEEIETIPAVLVVAADLSRVAMMDLELDRPAITGGASLYPFCWNILLAARSRGLGGVMTTFLSRAEPAAAKLLDLPDDWALAATMFLGYPVHQPTKLKRAPVEEFTFIDRFTGSPFPG
jgi:nitroreductase